MKAAESAMQKALTAHDEVAALDAKKVIETCVAEKKKARAKEASLRQGKEHEHQQRVARERAIDGGLDKMGGPSMNGAPPPTDAGRERLRVSLLENMNEFEEKFNTVPDATSSLGPPILEKVECLRKLTADDTDSVTALLVRGRDLTTDEALALESEVTAREEEKNKLVVSLLDELRSAQVTCTTLMQTAKLYLEAERARVAGERLAALEVIQEEQRLLMAATEKQQDVSALGPLATATSLIAGGGSPAPGSLEELDTIVVPRAELDRQKKEVQDDLAAAEQAVAKAMEAYVKATTDVDRALPSSSLRVSRLICAGLLPCSGCADDSVTQIRTRKQLMLLRRQKKLLMKPKRSRRKRNWSNKRNAPKVPL